MTKKHRWIAIAVFAVPILIIAGLVAGSRYQSTLGVVGFVGYVVDDVAADSPAAHAGIRQNDIVVTIDGRPVRSLESVTDVYTFTPPGKSIELRVLRYDPAMKRYTPHVFKLETQVPPRDDQIKWLYR